MPELPEVEHVRRSLEPLLVGGIVKKVALRRRDIVRNATRPRSPQLLAGATLTSVVRHGKDLAIVAADGRTLGVHLGMSGWLSWLGDGATLKREDDEIRRNHVHCVWHIDGPHHQGVLRFRDPRRFGGLWVFPTLDAWRTVKLAGRGPDAMTVRPHVLIEAFTGSRRPVKAALLDQSVLAGVGNIYADEALFAAGIHPKTSAHLVARQHDVVRRLTSHIHAILKRAIRSGGSSIRSYRGVNGDAGDFVRWHKVYGRAGQPCTQCSSELRSIQLAQRTTVFCPQCQRPEKRRRNARRASASAL
jgi:formamidopyrimidine-DNA glycosylase